MAKILDGRIVREKIKGEILERVKKLGRKPTLAIVQVGNREDSNIYIKNKIKFGEEIGVKVDHVKTEGSKEEKIIEEIQKLNEDKEVDGIIVQLPLPDGVDSRKILGAIDPRKDADGLKEGSRVVPATARAVMTLLDYYGVEIGGKRAAVIGRSRLAGGPIAEELRKRGAEVTVCHRSTENMPEVTRGCDILVSAAGKTGLVTKEFVNENQVVVDVGINRGEDGKLAGDVCFAEVEPIVRAISPVPGGVGPLTVACLFRNLLDLCDAK